MNFRLVLNVLNFISGEEFEKLYIRYEKEGRARRKVKAQALWYAVIESQVSPQHCHIREADATINLIMQCTVPFIISFNFPNIHLAY